MFKCFACEKLCQSPEIQCETPTQCRVLEIETIHFATPEGKGILVGSSRNTISISDKNIADSSALYLGCMTNPVPGLKSTSVRFAVTCPQCINNFPIHKD